MNRHNETGRPSDINRVAPSEHPPKSGRPLIYLPPALAVCGAVVAIDQGSKAIATSLVARGDREEVLPFLAIQNTRNRGIAFGLAGDVSALLIAAMLVGLLALLVFLASRATNGTALWLAAGLLVGGALGNLADRVRDGAVTDFIDLPLWPTFNLADLSIVAGVLLLVFAVDERAGPDDAA